MDDRKTTESGMLMMTLPCFVITAVGEATDSSWEAGWVEEGPLQASDQLPMSAQNLASLH